MVNRFGTLLAVFACLIAGARAGHAAQISMVRQNVATVLQRVSQSSGGFIGVGLQQLTAAVRKQLHYNGPSGAVVAKVFAGYPADKAGLSPGDVITSANGDLIFSPSDLTRIIGATPAGGSLRLDVWSGDSHRVVVVSVMARPASYAPNAERAPSVAAQASPPRAAPPTAPPPTAPPPTAPPPTAPPTLPSTALPAPLPTTRPLFAVVPVMRPDYSHIVITSNNKANDIRIQQLLRELQNAPGSLVIHERIAALAGKTSQTPRVPESARRYYVQANYLQKIAKTPIDRDLVIEDYEKAISWAPWWADAYYGLGTALEATQRYSDALTCLRLSLLASPRGAHARATQDKIYVVQAEQQRAAADQAAAAQATAAQAAAAAEAAAANAAAHAKAAAAQLAAAQAAAAANAARYEHVWQCHSTTCSSLSVHFSENGPFDASITGALAKTPKGTIELHGTMDGNDISGEALVPGGFYDSRTGCTTPQKSQSTFTGKDSGDGRTLTLTIMLPVFQGQSTETTVLHRAVFGPECASITQTGSNPATIVLVAR